MLPRRVKAAYYALTGPAMRLNGFLYRHLRAPRSGTIRAHLGPGQGNYLEGWINVDANRITARCDVWADLRNKLPFRTDTVDALYSHHVIEHLPDSLLEFHFREVFRCLRPGGAFRIGGPNGDVAIQKFVEGDRAWFNDYPDSRESLGGRFANFLLCRGEHLSILTFSYLEEIAHKAGFKEVRVCQPARTTGFPALFDQAVLDKEGEPTPAAPHTLIIEGRKE